MTQQDVDDWLEEQLGEPPAPRRAPFDQRDPLFVGDVARVETLQNASTESDVKYGLEEYAQAKALASAARREFPKAIVKATRNRTTGEVGVEIDISVA